jgi:hypothetical protein
VNLFPRSEHIPTSLEGYESDDSDSKPSKKKGDEDDMFGDEEEVVDKKKKDKKEVKFLQKGDIEGQEWESGGVEYEEDGTKIEPFNMDEELEEGWVLREVLCWTTHVN